MVFNFWAASSRALKSLLPSFAIKSSIESLDCQAEPQEGIAGNSPIAKQVAQMIKTIAFMLDLLARGRHVVGWGQFTEIVATTTLPNKIAAPLLPMPCHVHQAKTASR